MNITEANALNMILRFLIHGERGQEGAPLVESNRVRDAAADLADRAHKAIHAGYTGYRIRQVWPLNQVDRCDELADTLAEVDDGAWHTAYDDLVEGLVESLYANLAPRLNDLPDPRGHLTGWVAGAVAKALGLEDTEVPVAELGPAGREALG